jgi:hypothetical protein
MNNSVIFSIVISVIGALIAAIASFIVAVINHFSTKKNTRDLETFKTKLSAELTKELDSFRADIAEKQAEKNARRDYLYEARKRLYQEYEPFLFQLVELSESALQRIYGLARTARESDLGPNHSGWLSPDNPSFSYFATNTIYRFIAPLVIIKLIQRRLTLIDLTVDPHINNQYSLAKWLYHSYTQDFALARIEPRIPYASNNEEAQEKRKAHPEKYWRQGIVAGRLDSAVEALIVREPNGVSRCMSFGEFEEIYNNANTTGKFDSFREIFMNFHPKTRPVLWRILITQAHIYQALLLTREIKITASAEDQAPKLLKPISKEDRLKLDWRQKREEATDEEVLYQPFEAALAYLREFLGPLIDE